MQFEWDEDKRAQNIEKHGVDLLFAALIFDGPVLKKIDSRQDYGELRYISVGLVGNDPYVVVHTDRDGVTRLISAWQGGRKDYVKYKDTQQAINYEIRRVFEKEGIEMAFPTQTVYVQK